MSRSTAYDGRPVPAYPLWYCADAWLRLGCTCGHTATAQVRMLAGDAPRDTVLWRIVERLRCSRCGARIECGPGAHVCGLFLEGHPLDRMTFGVVGTITPLLDLWFDGGRLPDYVRAAKE